MMYPSKGRASGFNPPNRFEKTSLEPLEIELDEDNKSVPTTFYKDTSKTILSKNDSPDIPFTYSINPYRGCEHGCIYCYARPSHEYLGFSAGLDFETKIMVKLDAARLLEEELGKKRWEPQMVCFSGNTDCYQPVERKLQITRQCLEVFLKFGNPVGIITKNALVTRDIDILRDLAAINLVLVVISITTLDPELTRVMEPRTSTPIKKLEAVKLLASAGVPVTVNTAPIIPGLNDEELPALLRLASEHGAKFAGYTIVRLPGAIEPLFVEWVQRTFPERASKILNRIKDTRGGESSNSEFGKRMRGEGEIAKTIRQLFKINCEKYGLNKEEFAFALTHFKKPVTSQIEMF